MYGLNLPLELTPDHILQRITQEQIFEYVLKQPFNINFRYCSPCREDKKPGCRFDIREDGTILFIDFGEKLLTGRTHRTCFRLVMDAFGLNYKASIKNICDHFELPLDPLVYFEVEKETYTKKIIDTPRSSITYVPKDFTRADIKWWSQFLIRPEELIEDKVYSTRKYTVNSTTKGITTFYPYKYCYTIDFIDAVKIYQPFQDEFKWITNCSHNHIGNIDNLPPNGDRLIIQKSYKDHRVVRNVLNENKVCWLPNEGSVPNEEILRMLLDRFSNIFLFFDNDVDGILAGTKVTSVLNDIRPNSSKLIYLPQECKAKDPSDFVAREGRIDTHELLKTIGL